MPDIEIQQQILNCKGKVTNVHFIPTYFYEYLDKRGDIKYSKEEKLEFLRKATQLRKQSIREGVDDGLYNDIVLLNFSKMEATGEFIGAEANNIKILLRN